MSIVEALYNAPAQKHNTLSCHYKLHVIIRCSHIFFVQKLFQSASDVLRICAYIHCHVKVTLYVKNLACLSVI